MRSENPIKPDSDPLSEPNNEKAKILIVDDEKINIDVLVGLLKPNYRAVAAKSGEQALKRLDFPPLPDLILLDVTMPGMDGFEVCRQIKAREDCADIPIIFLTARTSPEDVTAGFRAGAVDYVTKPFQPDELAARVSTQLRLHHTIRSLEKALKEIKTLKGLLPICSSCKMIRDDQGYWKQIESYIKAHSDVEFTHGICPDCARKLYPELYGSDDRNDKVN
jgi:CheY-like chemotaxis protein